MPLSSELSLVDSATDPIVSAIAAYTEAFHHFSVANTSYEWSILNVHAKCDLTLLGSSLHESYINTKEEGNTFTVNLNTCISQYQTTPGQVDF